jgi:Na(+)-translocating NADH:ubiquinone oxidoreductase F subunit
VIFLRKLHKWLGLVIGAQFLVWLLSGLLISLVDQEKVSGEVTHHVVPLEASLAASVPIIPFSEMPLAITSIDAVTLENFITGPVYRVVSDGATILLDAAAGGIVRIDRALAERIARDSYSGDGSVVVVQRLESGSNEVRGVPGPIWRIDFDDGLATSVFVSEQDGFVQAHRNSRWRFVDFLLMLHFMDYVRVDSFNNPQIIAVGFGTLWIAMTGLLLVFNSFTRADFLWIPGMRAGGATLQSRVRSARRPQHQIALNGALSYYAGLAQEGVRLPSNCDGSGSCGLCRVKYEENVPQDTAVDREWIDAEALADGMRLACQHRPKQGDAIIVPDMAFQQAMQSAEVVSSRWLTPLLKEIRLRPEMPVDFVPGDYLEFQVPAFQVERDRFNVSTEFRHAWNDLEIPEHWFYSHRGRVARTYSIATAPNSAKPQELVFTVRFAPPPTGTSLPPGVGSSYMCSLQDGDHVEFRGPAGEFRLVDSNKEKILIGGGAGMAPLKSMVLHLLENQRWQGNLRYWYGARNQQEILYRDTFEALAANHANFDWQVALSDADDDREWEGYKGLVHEKISYALLKSHRDLRECEFYVCGPPQMLSATRRMLRDLGVTDSSVRFDDFGN